VGAYLLRVKLLMKVLDLFSGIGGFSLGLERAGMETVAFCEFDKKAQLVLKKHWPDVPIYDDVRELNGEKIREEIGAVQLISGGFPCQPFSQAGKRKGDQDDRHLWPQYFRLIQEIRPRWVIGENVNGLISMGLDQVLSDLESEDYSCQTLIIPACAVNAPHRRDRVWIIAHASSRDYNNPAIWEAQSDSGCQRNGQDVSNSECNGLTTSEVEGSITETARQKSERKNNTLDSKGTSGLPGTESDVADSKSNGNKRKRGTVAEAKKKAFSKNDGAELNRSGEDVADSDSVRQKSSEKERNDGTNRAKPRDQLIGGLCESSGTNQWAVEPDVGRVAHGIPNRVDRLKQLGNAVIPQVVEQIGRAIMQIERRNHGNDRKGQHRHHHDQHATGRS
jgi:DNA (cytosine-5)-methyltransferase 1